MISFVQMKKPARGGLVVSGLCRLLPFKSQMIVVRRAGEFGNSTRLSTEPASISSAKRSFRPFTSTAPFAIHLETSPFDAAVHGRSTLIGSAGRRLFKKVSAFIGGVAAC
jgi:hypothetical protein